MNNNEPKYQETELINLLREGSEYAFQLIYDKYRNKVYRLSLSYLKSTSLAQECVQDVFLKVWFWRKNFDAGSSIEPWIVKVTKNHLLNQLKGMAHKWVSIDNEHLVPGMTDQNVFDQIQYKQTKEVLQKGINQLSIKQKEVFLLARDGDLTYNQIAEKLKMSPLTVKTHMARALKSIKLEMKRHDLLFLLIFFYPLINIS